MTNAEARFNKSLRPRKPEGSLGWTAQDVHLDSHTAPELCGNVPAGTEYSAGKQGLESRCQPIHSATERPRRVTARQPSLTTARKSRFSYFSVSQYMPASRANSRIETQPVCELIQSENKLRPDSENVGSNTE